MVQEIEQRLEEEMERSNGWTNERKQLEQKLQDVTEQLEEEEHGRQKLQIERVQFEGKIKNFEDIVASQQNELSKVCKLLVFPMGHFRLLVAKRTQISRRQTSRGCSPTTR